MRIIPKKSKIKNRVGIVNSIIFYNNYENTIKHFSKKIKLFCNS